MLGGVLLGLIEALYSAHLRHVRFHRGFHDAADFLLCLPAALTAAAALAIADWGQLRAWSLFGMGVGAATFWFLGREFCLWLFGAILRILCRMARTMTGSLTAVARVVRQSARKGAERVWRRV